MGTLLLARGIVAPGGVAVVAERSIAPPRTADGVNPSAELIPSAGAGASDWAPWGLRVFALSRASERLLRLCGVWDRLPRRLVFPYERMCVWDETGVPGGRGSLSFDCAELGEPDLGHIVDGQALQDGCVQAANAAGVVFIETPVESVEVTRDVVRIALHDRPEVGGRLLIAADGAGSRSRTLLGMPTAGHSYHQDALVAHVRTAAPHRNTAWQRFQSTGPLAFLPLSDGRCSIVWSVARERARSLRALDAAEFAAAIASAGGGVLGTIELTTATASFPLHLQYALEYVRPRVALIGDAAHAVHPLAGQGLNLGFLDCATLAETLQAAAGSLGDYGTLRRYERRRKSENLLAAAALDGLERLFSSPHAAVATLRMTGLSAVGSVGLVRRRLARLALGIDGDVPAFVR
jgi:2-octaprenylphenol hydroxylase